MFRSQQLIPLIPLVLGLAACQAAPTDSAQLPQVIASTTIVGDVVKTIAGDTIELTILLSPGTDPHTFEPSPQDLSKISDANLLFLNGAGLEELMEPLIANASGSEKTIHLSDGIVLLEGSGEDIHAATESSSTHPTGDPHVWTDPNNILVWVDAVEVALSELNSAEAAAYQANAAQYRADLESLDEWIQAEVAQIPAQNRKLVTDHLEFTYFAKRYGFTLTGAVIPNYSTSAETSAQDLAALEDVIRAQGVQAIFVGNTTNPDLAQQVAEDTGVQLVSLLTGSLTEPGGAASTYLDYMRYNVNAITQALK